MTNTDINHSLEMLGHRADTYSVEELSRIQAMIASRMTHSAQQIPHFPLEMFVNADAVMSQRKKYKEGGKSASLNDVVLKAAALALKSVPDLNCGFVDSKRIRFNEYNVACAVAIEDGLMTPVLKNVDRKPLHQISEEMSDLASRSQSRRLKPDEYGGATFTVSNLGMFGVSRFGSIINEGQAAILSVGGLQKHLELDEHGTLQAHHRIAMTLTCDHRIVDGATGAKWLKSFADIFENPVALFE